MNSKRCQSVGNTDALKNAKVIHVWKSTPDWLLKCSAVCKPMDIAICDRTIGGESGEIPRRRTAL